MSYGPLFATFSIAKYEFLIEAISVLIKQTYSLPNNSKVYFGEYEKVESAQIL